MTVQVVTDSTADLPAEIAAGLGITVVPLKVVFGQESYRDRVDLTEDEFYYRLTTGGVHPKTSQPSVGEFEEVYRELLKTSQSICSIHLSSRLSGTIESATAAAQDLRPLGRIEVVDSRLVSVALGLVVIRVARAARRGADLDECVRLANETAQQTNLLFFVDTLEYLRKGGRIGRAAAFFGSHLDVKPLLKIIDGEVHPVERVRTRHRALERLFLRATEHVNTTHIAIVGSPPLDDCHLIRARLAEHFPNAEIIESVLGPVVGTHGGPGLVGVCVYDGPSFA